MKNVILIGMPGCGKSTIGVLLAKALRYDFVDADLLIQNRYGKLLRELIAEYGNDGFLKIENDVNLSIGGEHTVVATGGSAVYCTEAMEQYVAQDIVVYIQLSYEEIASRLSNVRQRGVVLKEGQTLRDLYNERTALYEKYAQITVNAEGLNTGKLLETILQRLSE